MDKYDRDFKELKHIIKKNDLVKKKKLFQKYPIPQMDRHQLQTRATFAMLYCFKDSKPGINMHTKLHDQYMIVILRH